MSLVPPLDNLRDSVAWPVLPVTEPLPLRRVQDLEPFPGYQVEEDTGEGEEETGRRQSDEDGITLSDGARPTTIGDLMSKDVIAIGAEQTIHELETLLAERKISGVPVVDRPSGDLLGVVSQADIVRHFGRRADPVHDAAGYHGTIWFDLFSSSAPPEARTTRVSEIMTPFAYYATENATLSEAIRLMLDNNIHRVVITRKRRLVGVVTSMDLLRHYQRELTGGRSSPGEAPHWPGTHS